MKNVLIAVLASILAAGLTGCDSNTDNGGLAPQGNGSAESIESTESSAHHPDEGEHSHDGEGAHSHEPETEAFYGDAADATAASDMPGEAIHEHDGHQEHHDEAASQSDDHHEHGNGADDHHH